jgi:two-component system, chemotaxis family, protein-glutamate methylesterase/glutaminase
MSPIRVLIVEDSPVVQVILKRIFTASPDIEIVGTAPNGVTALALLAKVKPDVICTDFHMAPMNGLEFTREVMQQFPRPILVISASVQAEDTQNVFNLLQAGAIDVFPKPTTGLMADYDRVSQELIHKIKILSGVKVFTRHSRPQPLPLPVSPSPQPLPVSQGERAVSRASQLSFSSPSISVIPKTKAIKMLAIGASTGGPQALHQILSQLPSKFPIPVICVQHISEGFLKGLVDWLALECHLPVKIAHLGEIPQPGVVYFPPERRHLELDKFGRFFYSATPPLGGHCPSVTITFQSIANFYRAHCAGVLLTGMGRDGADGMLTIAQAGGVTIAQDEASCIVFGMPKEAIALGAVQHILPLNAIAPLLLAKIM